MKKFIIFCMIAFSAISVVFAEGRLEQYPIPVKVLILPKFEIGAMEGDFPGEAQLYYEEYLKDSQEYLIEGGFSTAPDASRKSFPLFYKNGVALYVTGVGKTNAAMSTEALLLDKRFDFSDAIVISTGCAGGAPERTIMGDVIIASHVADFDSGHHADPKGPDQVPDGVPTWFYDQSYHHGYAINPALWERAYELTQDIELNTTPKTRALEVATFPDADWVLRNPKVIGGGTNISGDNYWKGVWGTETANFISHTYGGQDFMLTEMEDVAIADALNRFGLVGSYLIIRDSVNYSVFMKGASPLKLWGPEYLDKEWDDEDNIEAADISLLHVKIISR